MSLARLRQRQGRYAEAVEVLAPVYARFREGFATRDLKAARALLEQLDWEVPLTLRVIGQSTPS
jgi:predicted ATPase